MWSNVDALEFSEDGWPCQRLRVAFGAFLFVIFEVTIGKRLPLLFTTVILALGVASMVSAQLAIREFKLKTQLRIIQDAIRRSP